MSQHLPSAWLRTNTRTKHLLNEWMELYGIFLTKNKQTPNIKPTNTRYQQLFPSQGSPSLWVITEGWSKGLEHSLQAVTTQPFYWGHLKKQRFRDSCLKESLQKAFRGQLLLEKSQFDHKLIWPLLFQQGTVAYSSSSYFIFNCGGFFEEYIVAVVLGIY